MSAFPVGTHSSLFQHLRNRSVHSPFHDLRSLESFLSSRPFFGPSSCITRGLGMLSNHVLARAEDQARGSTSSFQPQQAQQTFEKQLQHLTTESGTCDLLCSLEETSS